MMLIDIRNIIQFFKNFIIIMQNNQLSLSQFLDINILKIPLRRLFNKLNNIIRKSLDNSLIHYYFNIDLVINKASYPLLNTIKLGYILKKINFLILYKKLNLT